MKRIICFMFAGIMAITTIFASVTFCENQTRCTAEDIATDLLDNINELRREKGLTAVELSDHHNDIAVIRAKELAKQWSHTRPNGTKWSTLFEKKYDSAYKGENLAYCQGVNSDRVASVMFKNLCESDAHYDNMVFKDFKYIGIAVYKIGDSYYSAMEFCSKQ